MRTKLAFPSYCNTCRKDGLFYTDYHPEEKSFHYIRCEKCGSPHTNIRCWECNKNGDFVEKVLDRPEKSQCPHCGNREALPSGFYQRVFEFQPSTVDSKKFSRNFLLCFALLIALIAMIGIIF